MTSRPEYTMKYSTSHKYFLVDRSMQPTQAFVLAADAAIDMEPIYGVFSHPLPRHKVTSPRSSSRCVISLSLPLPVPHARARALSLTPRFL